MTGTGNRRTGFDRKAGRFSAVVLCVLVLTFAGSRTGHAICEAPGAPNAAASAFDSAQTAQVAAGTLAIQAVVEAETNLARSAIVTYMNTAWDTMMLPRLNQFWEDWEEALKAMTAQLHAGITDQTRQMAAAYDFDNVGESARRIQRAEVTAKKDFTVTDQGCQFDSTAQYLGSAMQTARSTARGYAYDIAKLGNNNKDTAAASGAASLQKSRWDIYVNKFCDGVSNGGNPGCAPGNPMANAHITPSKTLFAKETIDLTDADTREAVSQLTYNISGYAVPDNWSKKVLSSAIGREQRQNNREYLAQMDAVSMLVTSIIGERTPGKPAPTIKAMRVRAGVSDASDTPSEREIRQATIEQLWDPKYFADLSDSPSTIPQKELYLKAYNLYALYKVIEKTEKISNVYAIETANLLDAYDSSRSSGSEFAPLRP